MIKVVNFETFDKTNPLEPDQKNINQRLAEFLNNLETQKKANIISVFLSNTSEIESDPAKSLLYNPDRVLYTYTIVYKIE